MAPRALKICPSHRLAQTCCGRAWQIHKLSQAPLVQEKEHPPAQNQYMQENILGELISGQIHVGPVFALTRIQKIHLRANSPHVSQILEGIHLGANACRACIRTRANTGKKPGELFMSWFRARGYFHGLSCVCSCPMRQSCHKSRCMSCILSSQRLAWVIHASFDPMTSRHCVAWVALSNPVIITPTFQTGAQNASGNFACMIYLEGPENPENVMPIFLPNIRRDPEYGNMLDKSLPLRLSCPHKQQKKKITQNTRGAHNKAICYQRESNMHRIEVHHFASPFAPKFPVGETVDSYRRFCRNSVTSHRFP